LEQSITHLGCGWQDFRGRGVSQMRAWMDCGGKNDLVIIFLTPSF
jgi:hypothetical protein